MVDTLWHLILMSGFALVAPIALGALSDHLAGERLRKAAIGVAYGLAVAAVMSSPLSSSGGPAIAAHGPLLLVAGLFGGPLGALAALALPFAMVTAAGGAAMPAALASVVVPAGIGVAVHEVHRYTKRPLQRSSVISLAGLAPLCLLCLLVPTRGELPPTSLPALLAWLPLGTMVFGLLTLAELARSDALRAQIAEEAAETTMRMMSHAVFRQHLEHHWLLHERYGSPYAYLLVSIDEGANLRNRLGERRWQDVRHHVGRDVRKAVRDSDVCTAIDFDRFAVLLPHCSAVAARTVAERIRANVARSFGGGRHGEAVSVSIGIADVGRTSRPDDLETAAEGALFLANAQTPRSAIGATTKPGGDGPRNDAAPPATRAPAVARPCAIDGDFAGASRPQPLADENPSALETIATTLGEAPPRRPDRR
ncbi:GGDEF domain-containing protein [Acuticoccus mangrovi]|uniref:GGDEF domain-containing protein n=1 Tax=Acuticoccus mangrovi TaxID=2796142 RepID=A0A934MIT2_9HYPH|nr:GGDEF domain-containing protein [Acuticoccus mangrovi]MBJ3777521.1 GGDEF domain-containing protein [Acuticoccus mangrovi]